MGGYHSLRTGLYKRRNAYYFRRSIPKKIEVVTKKGKNIAQIPSTTQLTVDEFIDYLCEIEMLCEDWNMTLPHNDDYQLAIYGNVNL